MKKEGLKRHPNSSQPFHFEGYCPFFNFAVGFRISFGFAKESTGGVECYGANVERISSIRSRNRGQAGDVKLSQSLIRKSWGGGGGEHRRKFEEGQPALLDWPGRQ